MNASREMPKYECHKKVWALKIAGIVGVFTANIPNAELADAIITVAAEHRQEPTP